MASILVSTLPLAGHINPARAAAAKLEAAGHSLTFALPEASAKLIGPQFGFEATTNDKFNYEPASFSPLHWARDLQKIENNIKYVLRDWTLCQLDKLREISERYCPDLIISDCVHLAPLIVACERDIPSAVLGVTPYRNLVSGSAPLSSGLAPAHDQLRGKIYAGMNRAIHWRFRAVTADLKTCLLRVSPGLEILLKNRALSVFGLCQDLASVYFQCSTPSLEDQPGLLEANGVEFIGPMNLENVSPISLPTNSLSEQNSNHPKAKVLITWGTMQASRPKHFVEIGKELSKSDDLAIVLAPPDAERNDVNNEFRSEILSKRVALTASFDDFPKVLRTADVLVSNGGFGAVKMALSLGVPVVCCGDQDDKPDVCGRVDRSGAGIGFSWRISHRRIVRSIRRVLREPTFKLRARVVGQELSDFDSSGRLERAVARVLSDGHALADIR